MRTEGGLALRALMGTITMAAGLAVGGITEQAVAAFKLQKKPVARPGTQPTARNVSTAAPAPPPTPLDDSTWIKCRITSGDSWGSFEVGREFTFKIVRDRLFWAQDGRSDNLSDQSTNYLFSNGSLPSSILIEPTKLTVYGQLNGLKDYSSLSRSTITYVSRYGYSIDRQSGAFASYRETIGKDNDTEKKNTGICERIQAPVAPPPPPPPAPPPPPPPRKF